MEQYSTTEQQSLEIILAPGGREEVTETPSRQKHPTTSASKRKSVRYVLNQILNGNLLKPLLQWRYMSILLLIVVLFIANTYIGYRRIEKINRIDRLEKRLQEIEYRHLFVVGEISKHDRKTSILESLREQGSTLIPDNDPPYVIYFNGKELQKEEKKLIP